MNRTISVFVRGLVCSLFLLLTVATASAQFKAGIQGTVKDTSGGLVPDAKITLTNNETGHAQELATGAEGFYHRVWGRAPGTRASAKNRSKKQIRGNIPFGGEGGGGSDGVLHPREFWEKNRERREDTQALETENGNVSRAVSTREIQQLPQVGRDPYELLRLTPGIFGDGARGGSGGAANLPNTTGPGGSNSSIFQVENQVPISANGQRLSSNNFQIDGVSVNSFNWGGAALVTPNQESVKEIRVLSSTYSAEDGRNSGAQIRVVSQNGTNQFHGSAFLKYNSPKLNAFNRYNGPGAAVVRVSDYVRQFGGSLGGPIYLPRFGEGGPVDLPWLQE